MITNLRMELFEALAANHLCSADSEHYIVTNLYTDCLYQRDVSTDKLPTKAYHSGSIFDVMIVLVCSPPCCLECIA